VKALKDLLYGSRNEYLDIVRLLALLGGVTFIALSIADFAATRAFAPVAFAGAWATLLGATTAAIYARNRSDIRHQTGDAPVVTADGGAA
jgi:hypothetical protein